MKKFKNFIPLDFEERELRKSELRIKKITKLMILINLILFPMAISNTETEILKKEEIPRNFNIKTELISLEKIGILMDKSKEYNSEIRINDNKFILRTSNLENNTELFENLYRNKMIKVESVKHGENFDEIEGVLQ